MAPKLLCGLLLTLVGLVFSSFCFIYAVMNPCNYNGINGLLGSFLGTIFSAFLTDPLVAVLMRLEGISNFSSRPGIFTILLPGAVVVIWFLLFAYLAAGRIRRTPLTSLMEE